MTLNDLTHVDLNPLAHPALVNSVTDAGMFLFYAFLTIVSLRLFYLLLAAIYDAMLDWYAAARDLITNLVRKNQP